MASQPEHTDATPRGPRVAPAPPADKPSSPSRGSALSRMLRMGLVRRSLPLFFAFLRLLPWRIVLGTGHFIGTIAVPLQRRRRQRATDSLGWALGDEIDRRDLPDLTRRVFHGLGMNLAEVCWVASKPQRTDALVLFEGLEHLQEARGRGKGVVLITGHLGSWELMASAIVRQGIPLSVIAREANDGKINEFLVGLRQRLGVRTVLRGSSGSARQILRTLRSGEVLGCLIDQDTKVDGVFVDFFGRPAYTPSGPISLALRAGAPVVLGCTWRQWDGRHLVRFDPPIDLDRSGDNEADVLRHTTMATRWLEDRIREHLDQWVWIHRRWRRKPPATPSD